MRRNTLTYHEIKINCNLHIDKHKVKLHSLYYLSFRMKIMLIYVLFCHTAFSLGEIPSLILESMSTVQKKDLFKAFHYLYRKSYDLNSEQGIFRYRVFKKSLAFIDEINKKNLGLTLGLNQCSDLTHEEFKVLAGNANLENTVDENMNHTSKIISNLFSQTEVESPIDHSKYLSKEGEHGICKACYAFSAVGTIEAIAKMQFGGEFSFSEQHLINCNPNTSGCQGGTLKLAFEYIKLNGLVSKNNVPYISGFTGKPQPCQRFFSAYKIVSDFIQGSGKQKLIETLRQGPVSTTIDFTSPLFQYYSKGVLIGIKCSNPTLNIILYGYSSDLSGSKEIYSARTSVGAWWGENSNFKIDNLCLMDKLFFQPMLSLS